MRRLIYLLLLIVFALKSAYSWYYPNFKYRLPVYIEYTGETVYNATLNITLNTQSLINEGKLNSDCSDIRVTALINDIEQEVPFWVNETTCNTTNTTIWIRLSELSGNTTLYIYYGNPQAESASNRSAVFDVYQGSYDTGRRYYDTGTYTVVDMGVQKLINYGYLEIYYYDSDGDTWWVRAYCDSTEIYYSGTRGGYSGLLVNLSLSGRKCQAIRVRMYDTERNDYVQLHGNYYIEAVNVPDFNYTFGSEQLMLEVWYDIYAPENNTIVGVPDVSIEAKIYLSENYTLDKVYLILDNATVHVWYNVTNETLLQYTIEGLGEGRHEFYFVASILNYNISSNISVFYVDLTPPDVTIIKPQSITYRIHFDNTTIPLYVEATDNIALRSCYILLWNDTNITECNREILLNVSGLSDGSYTIKAYATDFVNHTTVTEVTFSLDFSQGYIVYDEVSYPSTIPAHPFNISAKITCLSDWCDSVKSYIQIPASCSLQTPQIVELGDMEEYETKEAVWTISCSKNHNYTFAINTSVANGYFSVYRFTAHPPHLNIYIQPQDPSDDDDLLFILSPHGYDRDITVEVRIVRYRPGGASTLLLQNFTIPDKVNTTIYTVLASDTMAGDKYIFYARVVDPISFYEEKNTSVVVKDIVPPSFLYIQQKYQNTAPHDDPQNITFGVSDNYLVSRVDLYVDFGNGTYILYKTKDYNSDTVLDSMLINHYNYTGKTIHYYLVAYDKFNNSVISSIQSYNVVRDNPPTIYIQYPENNSVVSALEIPFAFRASDDFSTSLICKILNKTIHANSGELVSTTITVSPGYNNLTIMCSDEFNNTANKTITVYADITPPYVKNITYYAKGSTIYFNITAADDYALKSLKIEFYLNNTTIYSEEFTLSGKIDTLLISKDMKPYAGNIIIANITIYDLAGNYYNFPPILFAVSQPQITETGETNVFVNMPPLIQIKDAKVFPNYIVELKFFVDDEDPYVSCELSYDSTTILLGNVPTNRNYFYNVSVGNSGVYTFQISCTDSYGLRGYSNMYRVNVSYVPYETKPLYTAYSIAVSIKDPRISAPLGLGVLLSTIGALANIPLLVVAGAAFAVGGPIVAYGIINANPIASAVGVSLAVLVWIVVDMLIRRKYIPL